MEAAKKRLARKQVDAPVTDIEHSNDMSTHNIWYHRRRRDTNINDAPRARGVKEASQYRCHPAADAGWTRGEGTGCTFMCLYFARGICHHGPDCNYLHRIPTALDEENHRRQPQYDIFGRDREAEIRGTKGVGSYNRQCTTLYIYFGGAASATTEQLVSLFKDNFKEWGPIENVYVVRDKAIAFVTYAWRSSAEFAKAAMHQQSLRAAATSQIPGHVLDVRWANDDKNPRAQARVKRQQEEAMSNAYLDAMERMGAENKRAKLHEVALTAAYVSGAVASAYPDTGSQYRAHRHDDGGGENDQYGGWDVAAYGGDGRAAVASHARGRADGWDDANAAQERVGEEEEDDISRYLLPGGDVPACYENEDVAGGGDGVLHEVGGQQSGSEQVVVGQDATTRSAQLEGQHAVRRGGSDALVGLVGGYGSDNDADTENG